MNGDETEEDAARIWLDESLRCVAVDRAVEFSSDGIVVGKPIVAALSPGDADSVVEVLRTVLDERGEALIETGLAQAGGRAWVRFFAQALDAPTGEGAVLAIDLHAIETDAAASASRRDVPVVESVRDVLAEERTWAALASRLVGWADQDLRGALDEVLQHAGADFGAIRTRLLERATPGATSTRAIACWGDACTLAEGPEPLDDPWLLTELQSGRWIEGLPLDALPPAGHALMNALDDAGARAWLAMPCQPARGDCAVYLEFCWSAPRGPLDARETERAIRIGEVVASLWRRHQAAIARVELDRRAELLSAHRSEGYVEVDALRRVRLASRNLERLLGRASGALAGAHVDHVVHPADLARVSGSLDDMFAGRAVDRLVFRAMHDDGSARWLEAIGTPTADESGAPLVVSVIRDISSRELERATLVRRHELERLIAGLTRRFLAADVDALDAILEESLVRIADAMSATRVSLVAFPQETEGRPAQYRFERARTGGIAPPMTPSELSDFPWCRERMRTDEILEIPDVGDLPPEAERDRRVFERLGVVSVLAVSATEGERVAGILTVHGDSVVDAFPEDEKRLLRVLAELCTGALKRQASARELCQSEERFRALAENMRDSICEIGEDGRILYASPSYASLMGGEQSAFVGTDPLDHVDPDDRRRAQYLFRPGARSRRKGTLVYRAQSLAARSLHLESTASEFEGQDGTRRVVVATRDVTEREQARVALDRQLQLEARVAELSRYFVDVDVAEIHAGIESRLAVVAELADAEHSWMYSFGTGPADALERFDWWRDDARKDPSNAPRNLPAFPYSTGLIRSGQLYHVPDIDSLPPEAHAERDDMRSRGVRSVLGIPIMSGGQFVGLLGFERFDREVDWSHETIVLLRMAGEIFYSTLRRRRAAVELGDSQAQLLQSQKMEAVGTLAGGIAHDFNNHLAVMLGNARFVRQEVEGPADVLEAIDDFERSADHCAQLTRSLLAFSRRSPVEVVPVRVDELVQGVEGLVRPLLPAAIDLEVAILPDLGRFEVDRVQIQQVLVNLIVNARDAMPDGGPIRLQAVRRGVEPAESAAEELRLDREYVVLSVEDRGIGMDEETRGRVFEPFFTTKDLGSGTGLGLAMAYGIVQQTGGAITVDSAPGRGTTFRVYLPASEESVSA